MTDDKLILTTVLRSGLVKEVDRLASSTAQDRNSIIERALELYLGSEASELHDDASGFAELDQGRFTDLDDVLKKASLLVDDAEAERARRAG